MRFVCLVCREEMLQLEEGQEIKIEQAKNNGLPIAKVVSFGFFDLLPIPAGSKLDMFRQELQTISLTEPIKTKEKSFAFKQLSEIIYNPINDDISGNYKKQRTRQVWFYYFLGFAGLELLFILYLCLI